MSLFRKASGATKNFFKKGGQADSGFRKISSGLGQAGGVLKQVGSVGSQIANVAQKITSNPIVDAIGMAIAPEIAVPLLAGSALAESALKRGSQLTKKAGQGLKQASNITDVGSYQGSTLENLQDAKRRIDATAPSQPAFV